MLSNETLLRTPLYDSHVALGAKMVPFGGWEMPVQYEGILAEYEATRKASALFDICHMGEFRITGDVEQTGLDQIATQPLKDLPIKSSRYGFLLNDKGGVLDDLIIFREDKDKWFIVVNASTTPQDAKHFKSHLKDPKSFQDISKETGKLDLQGPTSRDVLKSFVPDIGRLEYFCFDYFDLLGEKALISRTGYTGELGYEIFYPAHQIKKLWDALLNTKQVAPAGLGARDCLRLEMGYSLYGHELTEEITPLEAGLSKFVDFNKEFIGKKALIEQKNHGIKRKLVGFVSESRRSPRSDHKIFNEQLENIGVVTSGSFSPALNKGIGLGLVKMGHEAINQKILFGDDKNKNPAIITSKAFIKNTSIKS
jgi:aminomethyltransferase